ncbi:hypothetical protein RP20_CCG006825 [Aedes albopictus]|nr:hypothetical protein RP20_CCG006825 [Aedes albopictus]
MVFTRDAAAAAQAGAATTMTRGEVFVWREDCRLVGGVSFEQRSRSVYWNVTAIVVVHVPIEQSHLNLFANRPQPKKKRKSRTAFTNHQIFELEKRFLYQKYLSPSDRDEIAAALGLSNAQVITWFQNRRAKLKRDMEELKKDVETVKVLSAHKSFLENVNDMNILKKKIMHNDGGGSPHK